MFKLLGLLLVLVLAVVLGLVFFRQIFPDIQRYLRMYSM
jgi:hypothetical protein